VAVWRGCFLRRCAVLISGALSISARLGVIPVREVFYSQLRAARRDHAADSSYGITVNLGVRLGMFVVVLAVNVYSVGVVANGPYGRRADGILDLEHGNVEALLLSDGTIDDLSIAWWPSVLLTISGILPRYMRLFIPFHSF